VLEKVEGIFQKCLETLLFREEFLRKKDSFRILRGNNLSSFALPNIRREREEREREVK